MKSGEFRYRPGEEEMRTRGKNVSTVIIPIYFVMVSITIKDKMVTQRSVILIKYMLLKYSLQFLLIRTVY